MLIAMSCYVACPHWGDDVGVLPKVRDSLALGTPCLPFWDVVVVCPPHKYPLLSSFLSFPPSLPTPLWFCLWFHPLPLLQWCSPLLLLLSAPRWFAHASFPPPPPPPASLVFGPTLRGRYALRRLQSVPPSRRFAFLVCLLPPPSRLLSLLCAASKTCGLDLVFRSARHV